MSSISKPKKKVSKRLSERAPSVSVRPSRINFIDAYLLQISRIVNERNLKKVLYTFDNVEEDLTPPLIRDNFLNEKLSKLHKKVQAHTLMSKPRLTTNTDYAMVSQQRTTLGAMRTSMDDIEAGINHSKFKTIFPIERQTPIQKAEEEEPPAEPIAPPRRRVAPYIKIILRNTEDISLYEQRSLTVIRDTEEGNIVEADNKVYDFLTLGKGKIRRTSEAEAQTVQVLCKSREANTETIKVSHIGSYVSNFEMYDTYKDLEATTSSVDVDDGTKMEVTTYKIRGKDNFNDINEKPNFKLALMVTMRILASNVLEQEQRRFRNLDIPDPLSKSAKYQYRLRELFCYEPQSSDKERRAVADMSWCVQNGDILAAAYGIYTFSAMHVPKNGYVCVWNIKNPVNPERTYYFNVPVVSIEFSPFVPQLVAVGLYDGTVEVLDITKESETPVAVSQRSTLPTCQPVTAIKWISNAAGGSENADIEPFLALSQNGSVTKYRIINGPYLLGYQQILLDRVEGSPEGLMVRRPLDKMLASRHPQGLNLTLNPVIPDIYYVLTDEGCVHKCSTNYPHQHLEVSQTHVAAVNSLEFSPWSPSVYLTCGNDWCIRIWMEGIVKPMITLKVDVSPIQCANWSQTHSTIIVAVTRNTIDIWDIRRNILKPVSSTTIRKSFHSVFKFSLCGRSLAVGNERGAIMILAIEDVPFPPHFQYKELEAAIYKAIALDPDLTNEVKSIGYFGHRRR